MQVAAVLFGLIVLVAQARVTRWTGASSTSNYWNDNGNWDSGAPGPNDDAVISAARPCLVTADVAINSLLMTGSARLTLNAFQFTAGSITISDSAVLQFQGGGSWTPSLKSTNLSTIASPGGLEIHSGNLEGNWAVASNGSISFPDPATAFLINAKIDNKGTISFGSKTLMLNQSTIYSEDSGKFSLTQGAVLITLDDNSALKATSGVMVSGQAEIQGNAYITGLTVTENAVLTFSKGSQSTVNGVTLKSGAKLQNSGSGSPTFNNVQGAPQSTLYAGLPLVLGGTLNVDTLVIDTHGLDSPASITGTSQLLVNNLMMNSGGIALASGLNVNSMTVSSGVSFSGGSLNVRSANFAVNGQGGVSQFKTIFNNLGTTTVSTSQMWNVMPPATINLGSGANLLVQKDLQVFGVGSASGMVMNVAGNANISGSLSVTSLPINGGTGGFWNVGGKFTVTATSFVTKSVVLTSNGADFEIGGSTMTVGMVQAGPSSNCFLTVTDRGVTFQAGNQIRGLSSSTATAMGFVSSC